MSRRPAVGALAGAGRILFKTSAHAVDREAKIISVQFSSAASGLQLSPRMPTSKSGSPARFHLRVDQHGRGVQCHLDVVVGLQIDPKLRARAEISRPYRPIIQTVANPGQRGHRWGSEFFSKQRIVAKIDHHRVEKQSRCPFETNANPNSPAWLTSGEFPSDRILQSRVRFCVSLEEPIQILWFQRTPYQTRQLPRLPQAGAEMKNYPSLPEFPHPYPPESPQNPPSAPPMVSEELVQERPRGAPANGATWFL